ncbi:MAG: hypothetical protein QOE59_4825 [Actinomycetota bacterium]|jgi:hypothetical protein|nr:hypothetical protein [Actinomycetota bacterium]
MSTSTHEPGPAEHPTAADALAAIDDAQERTVRSLRPSPLGMFAPWGLGYLIGFGGVWLAARGVLPDGVVPVLLVVAGVVPVVSTGVTLTRSNRGLAGPSRRVGTLYGWAWVLGFAALCAINLRLTALGVPGPTLSLIWSGSGLLVVGLLYLAGGALWNHVPQYVLGIWTLVTAVATVFVGYPANFLVLALAGGGGFVVLGVWMHLAGRR